MGETLKYGRRNELGHITGCATEDTTQGGRTGYLVEFGDSKEMFDNPKEKHTREYIRGEFS